MAFNTKCDMAFQEWLPSHKVLLKGPSEKSQVTIINYFLLYCKGSWFLLHLTLWCCFCGLTSEVNLFHSFTHCLNFQCLFQRNVPFASSRVGLSSTCFTPHSQICWPLLGTSAGHLKEKIGKCLARKGRACLQLTEPISLIEKPVFRQLYNVATNYTWY